MLCTKHCKRHGKDCKCILLLSPGARRIFQLLVVAAYICAVCSGDLGRLVVAEKGENDALD